MQGLRPNTFFFEKDLFIKIKDVYLQPFSENPIKAFER